MTQTPDTPQSRGRINDWLIVLALAGGFVLWGLFLFTTVGSKGPPAWEFGVVPDVPGLSQYSTAGQRPLPTVASPYLHEQAELTPQHVRGQAPTPSKQAREQQP